MGKWNIPYPRQTFVDEYRRGVDRILAEVEACKKRMLPQWKMLRSFKNLKFADTWKGNDRERKVEKRSKKVREKYETFLSYGEETQYNKILRDLISTLRDEDDPNEWRKISRRHMEELNKLRGDMQVAYYDFLDELKELITFIKDQKREEMEEMDALKDDIQDSKPLVKEMTEMTNEQRTKIAEVLYEKCMFGEITEAQRDAAIEKLNGYTGEEPMYELGNTAEATLTLVAAVLLTLSPFIAMKIGSKIQRKRALKLVKYYETTYPDKIKVKFSDLDMTKLSLQKASQYSKKNTLDKVITNSPNLQGSIYIAKHNGKPFALCGRYGQMFTQYGGSSNGFYSAITSGAQQSYYEPLCAEAEKNDDYYATVISMVYDGVMTPEIKQFWKKYHKEMKEAEKKLKKKEKATKESVDFSYTDKRDDIIKILYEKCDAGEITLDQREAAINRLNFYCEGEEIDPTEKVQVALDDYIMGESTAEELDLALTAIYESSPETETLFTAVDLDERYEIVENAIKEYKESGEATNEELKSMVEFLEAGYDVEATHRFTPFFGDDNEVEMLESAMDADDNYYEILDSYYLVKESVDELLEDGTLTQEEADAEYEKLAIGAYQQFYETAGAVLYLQISSLIQKTITTLVSLIATPINSAVKKAKAKKVIKAYETINADTIGTKMSDLSIKKISESYAGEKYYPELRQMVMTNASIKGTYYLASKGAKPFAFCGTFQFLEKRSGGGLGSTTTKAEPHIIYKSLCPEAKRHEEYYRAMMILIYVKRMTVEVKDFCKEFLKKAKAMDKAAKKEMAAKQKAEKAKAKANKVAKEYVEEDENDILYNKTVEKIRALYENGDISLENREQLLMDAQHHFYLS